MADASKRVEVSRSSSGHGSSNACDNRIATNVMHLWIRRHQFKCRTSSGALPAPQSDQA